MEILSPTVGRAGRFHRRSPTHAAIDPWPTGCRIPRLTAVRMSHVVHPNGRPDRGCRTPLPARNRGPCLNRLARFDSVRIVPNLRTEFHRPHG